MHVSDMSILIALERVQYLAKAAMASKEYEQIKQDDGMDALIKVTLLMRAMK